MMRIFNILILFVSVSYFGVFAQNETPKQFSIPQTGGVAKWIKLGTYTAVQSGYMIKISVIGHVGYNAANEQDFESNIYFKTSNNDAVDAYGFAGNSQYYVIGPNAKEFQAAKWVANAAGINATSYDLYIRLGAFTIGSTYTVENTSGLWSNIGQVVDQNDPGSSSNTICVATNQYIIGTETTLNKSLKIKDSFYFYNRYNNTSSKLYGMANDEDKFKIWSYDGTIWSERFILLNNGNIGIGTSNPTEKLEVSSNGDVGIRLFNTSANTWDIRNSQFGKLDFVRGGNNLHFRIDQFGNVGIGTPSPGSKLHLYGGSQTIESNSGAGITILNTSDANRAAQLSITGDGDFSNRFVKLGSNSTAYGIDLYNGALNFMRILNNGYVGIGTTTPSRLLEVNGEARMQTLNLTISGANSWTLGTQASRFFLYNNTTGSEAFSVINNGNIGIGATNPVKKLEVTDVIRSTSNFAGFESIHNSGTSYRWTLNNDNAFYLQSSTDKFIANATNSIVTFPDGNVAINSTSNNGYKLNVNGIASFTGGAIGIFNSHQMAVYSNDGAKNVSFRRQISGEGDTNGIAHFGYNGSNYSLGIVEKDNGRIGIGIHDPSERLSVNGRIYINNTDARFHVYNGGAFSEWLFGQKSSTSHDFTFSQLISGNETDRLTITTNGYLGVGTTNPQAKLDVVGGSAKVEENFILQSNRPNNVKNSWIFHNPGDGRTALYMTPMSQVTQQWDWSKQTVFENNGNVGFSGVISVGGTDQEFPSQITVPESAHTTSKRSVITFGKYQFVSDPLSNGTRHLGIYNANNASWPFWITNDSKIGIGTTSVPADYKLAVAGNIIAEKVKVKKSNTWPDFVFSPNYNLPTLIEVESFVKQNSHLPEIPSANEIEKDGQDLGEMNRLLLKKVEELTLYLIEQNKEIKAQKLINESMQNEIRDLKATLKK